MKRFLVDYSNFHNHHLRSLMGGTVLMLWAFLFINSLLPRSEMLIFSGSVPIPHATLKLFLLISTLSLFFLDFSIKIPRALLLIFGALITGLIVNFCLISTGTNYNLIYIVFSYEELYFYFLITPLVYSLKSTVTWVHLKNLFFIIGLALAGIGLFQYLFQSPLLALQSDDNYFQVHSWNFFGNVRAFSMFSSSERFGLFLIFFVPFCCAAGAQSHGLRRILFWSGALMGLATTYATLTRSVYLWMAAALLTYICLSIRTLRPARMLLLPTFFLIGLLIAFAAPLFSNLLHSQHLGSIASLGARYTEWQHWGHRWIANLSSFLFGTGLIQNGRFTLTKGIIIDNNYLALGLQGGVFLLLIIVIFLVWMTRDVFQRALISSSPIHIGLACAFSTWPLAAMFNNILPDYGLIFVATVIVYPITFSNLYEASNLYHHNSLSVADVQQKLNLSQLKQSLLRQLKSFNFQ